ncbi:MAG: hypothetical protein WC729_07040 [Sphingomonas sp.]|jgi:hypothetical protein|uniref:hypothetical protein n=1 Tax=Sphingomonas sp. TaxID=28214 RepID=UPI0035680760
MRANEHVDAVDLVQRQPVDRAAQAAPIGTRGMRGAEALRGERDPPRLCERDRLGQDCSAR